MPSIWSGAGAITIRSVLCNLPNVKAFCVHAMKGVGKAYLTTAVDVWVGLSAASSRSLPLLLLDNETIPTPEGVRRQN